MTATTSTEQFMPLAQAAKAINISTSRLRYWVHNNDLPHSRVHGAIVIDLQVVYAFLKRCEHNSGK